MNALYDKALTAAQRLCASNGSTLLYLTVFGSELYGTSTGQSDLDVRGLFLPSLQSIVLRENQKSLHFSTSKSEAKNTHDDMDIDLWSLDHWLLNLLPSGDTGALDLLFSPSNNNCVILKSPLLEPVFANPQKLLNLADNKKYAEYSLSQAKKYGIKGSRLGALRRVCKWLDAHAAEGRLIDHIDGIVESCGNAKYCFSERLPDGPALVLCGKIHVGTIRMKEFRARVARDMEKFGERAKAAEANQGVDYKALSHAMRALDQMEELITTGRIEYPLKSREKLINIKRGAIPWLELEPLLLNRLEELNSLYEKHAGRYTYDWSFAKKFLLNCYELGEANPDKPFS